MLPIDLNSHCMLGKGFEPLWALSLSRSMTKPTKWTVLPVKTQISLGICPVWSESSLCAWRNLGSLATHWVHSEDSDQTAQMCRLIWDFAGCRCQCAGFVMLWIICLKKQDSKEILKLQARKLWTLKMFFCLFHLYIGKYDLSHDKTNKMTCAPIEDSDQPGHSPSLIRVFTVHSVGS